MDKSIVSPFFDSWCSHWADIDKTQHNNPEQHKKTQTNTRVLPTYAQDEVNH